MIHGICNKLCGPDVLSHVQRLVLWFVVAAVTAFTSTSTVADSTPYKFGQTSFSDSVWIHDGALFKNTKLVEVEMTNAGAFKFQIMDPEGKVLRERLEPNPKGGWHTFDFNSGIMGAPPGPGPYKFRFVNAASGVREIHGGNVWER
jgi:hypothetical protein